MKVITCLVGSDVVTEHKVKLKARVGNLFLRHFFLGRFCGNSLYIPTANDKSNALTEGTSEMRCLWQWQGCSKLANHLNRVKLFDGLTVCLPILHGDLHTLGGQLLHVD